MFLLRLYTSCFGPIYTITREPRCTKLMYWILCTNAYMCKKDCKKQNNCFFHCFMDENNFSAKVVYFLHLCKRKQKKRACTPSFNIDCLIDSFFTNSLYSFIF